MLCFFIVFTIFTDLSSTYLRHAGIFFTASCSLWVQQCVTVAQGATACMRAASPFCFPVIAVALSVQIPTHLVQSRLFCTMKSLSESKMASPVVSKEQQKRNSYTASINVPYKEQQICLSSCSVKNWIWHKCVISWFCTFTAMAVIFRWTVSLNGGTLLISLLAFSLNNICKP